MKNSLFFDRAFLNESLNYLSVNWVNLNTYLRIGARTAYHGRYLVPVLGFVYFFAGMLVYNSAKNLNTKYRHYFVTGWIFMLATVCITHFPPMLLYIPKPFMTKVTKKSAVVPVHPFTGVKYHV